MVVAGKTGDFLFSACLAATRRVGDTVSGGADIPACQMCRPFLRQTGMSAPPWVRNAGGTTGPEICHCDESTQSEVSVQLFVVAVPLQNTTEVQRLRVIGTVTVAVI